MNSLEFRDLLHNFASLEQDAREPATASLTALRGSHLPDFIR
jgi:hypothetical protein